MAKITRTLLNLFEVAYIESQKSNVHKAKMAAILTDRKYRSIYAKAHNRNYYGSNFKFSIHAEEDLISSYRKGFSGKTLVIYRRASYGVSCSKPCSKCLKLINLAGIEKIAYFDNFGNFVEKRI